MADRFAVTEKKEKNLAVRMGKLGISEKDVLEKFIRPGGKGGRKADSTSCCVYLKHIPTGTEVKCSRERSRSVNRFIARRLLADKIEKKITGKISAREQKIQKIRRQKRKRSRRAKEKVLEYKHKNAEKKKHRSYVKKMDSEIDHM